MSDKFMWHPPMVRPAEAARVEDLYLNPSQLPDLARPVIRSGEIWYGGMFAERNPRYELHGMLPKPKPPLSDGDLDWLETMARQHRKPKGDDPIHDGILSLIAEVRRRRERDAILCDDCREK